MGTLAAAGGHTERGMRQITPGPADGQGGPVTAITAVSGREAEVLEAIGAHLSNAQIAGRLHISVRTVESHVSSLLRKFGVPDRRSLADLAPAVAARPHAGSSMVAGLPSARTSFIGRSHEQAAVLAALGENRLVTLLGPGGIGKTRLAARIAQAAVAHYPLGASFIDLVPVREGYVAEAAAAVLGVTERAGQSLEAVLHEYFGRGRALLVLDNCEHLLPVVAVFAEKLLANCDNLTVLATSRERLAIAGERIVSISPLSVAAGDGDDAVAALSALVVEMAEHAPTKLAMAGHLLGGGGFGEAARAASERVGVVVGEVLERAQATGRVRRDVGLEEIYFLVRGVAQAQAFLPVEPGVRRRAIQVLVDGLRIGGRSPREH